MKTNKLNVYYMLSKKMNDAYTKTYCLVKDFHLINLHKGDIIAYDSYNNIVKVVNRENNDGSRLSDTYECYVIPLNITSKWFLRYEKQYFDNETIVLYNKGNRKKNTLYKITGYVGAGINAGTYNIKEIYGVSEYENVPLKDIVKADTYWYFNSKGSKCLALIGADDKADEFRMMTNNYYKTREEIDLAYMQMKGLAQK